LASLNGSSAELVGKAPFPGDVLGGSTTHELVVQEEPCGLCGQPVDNIPVVHGLSTLSGLSPTGSTGPTTG